MGLIFFHFKKLSLHNTVILRIEEKGFGCFNKILMVLDIIKLSFMIRPGKNYEAIVLDIFLFPILAIFPPFEAMHSPLYVLTKFSVYVN